MTIEYLVNLGSVQLYFDAERNRCKPPGCEITEFPAVIYFELVRDKDVLLSRDWDVQLKDFDYSHRAQACLYQRLANTKPG